MAIASPGVRTVKKTGSASLRGDVTLTGGTNVTLTQSGQDISIAASGGGGGASGIVNWLPTYDTNIEQDPSIVTPSDSSTLVPVADGTSFQPAPGDPLGATTIQLAPVRGLFIDQTYGTSWDGDPTVFGVPPNIIEPIESQNNISTYSQSTYTPGSPLDLHSKTAIEGAVVLPPLYTNFTANMAQQILSDQNQLSIYFYQQADASGGIYLPGFSTNYLGFDIQPNLGTAYTAVPLEILIGNAAHPQSLGGHTIDMTKENVISFRHQVAANIITVWLNGQQLVSETRSTRMPVVTSLAHLFTITAQLFANLDQGNRFWDAGQGTYISDTYRLQTAIGRMTFRTN